VFRLRFDSDISLMQARNIIFELTWTILSFYRRILGGGGWGEGYIKIVLIYFKVGHPGCVSNYTYYVFIFTS
jgi:hypothetical protein